MNMKTFVVCLVAGLLSTGGIYAQSGNKAAIMAANQQFVKRFAEGAEHMGMLYTTTAELMPPGNAPLAGSAAIDSFWKGAYDSGVKRVTLETIEVIGVNPVVETGHYTLYGEGDTQLDSGKYMVVWKQEKGGWKLHRDIWNTNTPPPPVASK